MRGKNYMRMYSENSGSGSESALYLGPQMLSLPGSPSISTLDAVGTTPTLLQEVQFVSGLNPNGTAATTNSAFADEGGVSRAFKLGGSTAGTGAAISYSFDPTSNFTTAEKNTIREAFANWAAVANVTFTEDNDSAHVNSTDILLNRNTDGTAYADPDQSVANGTTLGHPQQQIFVTVDVETFGLDAPSAWRHEIGHALGLGHGGNYNGLNSTPPSTQFSAFDDHQYTTMSYVSWADSEARYGSQNPNPGTDWGLNPEGPRTYSDSIQMIDILAIQQLYGVAINTPFNGGQTYGFNSNISGRLHNTYDFTVNTLPVVTLFNKGLGNTLDVSLYTSHQRIDLNDGKFSDVGGLKNNIAIAIGTRIDNAIGGSGSDDLTGNAFANSLFGKSGADIINGRAGSDMIDGGTGVDKAVFAGARSAYTITQGATGVFTVTGADGTDTLTNTEYAQFDNQTVRLLPGTGTTVNFQTDSAATYMAAVRDFDGNNLGAAAGWVKIGTADINGDSDADQVFANRTIGRFAEVGTAADGKVYFSDFGWAGETRVVGIYIDPLVQSGQVTAGGPNDSQRRFQNDLTIGNIKGVLGAGDYDHNGLQEVYFSLTDGTAYLHAYMHADGNIQYANYQSQQQVIDYLVQNNWSASTYTGWFG